MCLAIPKKIISVKKNSVLLQSPNGRETVVSLIKVKKGDWVLTQNHIVVKKINKNQAEKINKLFKSKI
ncbi:MAG: HypC/HybG/HupF family hydrogenase formation chaperone [Patescibacteria group bacterium]|jgi:hydrogenase maturation factor